MHAVRDGQTHGNWLLYAYVAQRLSYKTPPNYPIIGVSDRWSLFQVAQSLQLPFFLTSFLPSLLSRRDVELKGSNLGDKIAAGAAAVV